MTILLKFYVEDDTYYGIFDGNMSFEKISASSSEELVKIAENRCDEEYGKEVMLRASLQINQVNPPK